MVRKRIKKIKKALGSTFLLSLAVTLGHGSALASTEMEAESPSTKRRSSIPSEESKVVKIMDGVYAGQGIAPSGENIYFGMELVDEANLPKWVYYKRQTQRMTEEGRGLMHGLAQLSLEKVKQFGLQKRIGYTDAELIDYMNIVEREQQRNPVLKNAVRGVYAGTLGFIPQADGNHYVAYISKKPITGRLPFLGQPQTDDVEVKTYNEIYADILMSVGVLDGPASAYENRGIFRNPASFLSGGYKNMSLKLHGFTAAVMSEFFDDKKYFFVKPVKSMHTILAKKIPADQMLIADDSHNYGFAQLPSGLDSKTLTQVKASEDVVEKAFENPLYASGRTLGPGEEYGFEVPHLIKIKALIDLYKKP
jgi:hypothetical protein